MKKETVLLINKIEELLRKEIVRPNQTLLLMISGGQDSICLLVIFLQFRNKWNFNLGLIWCNHLWQSKSFYSTRHLFKMAHLLHLPIYYTLPLTPIANECLARNWRYKSTKKIAEFYQYKIVVTGHTASDRVETMVLNLIRGSGGAGLYSLRERKNFTNYFE
jgi:tRNA(Ile)-lysidine synthase